MTEEKVKVAPCVCSYVDDTYENINLEIAIPGVPKENIDLKMREDSFSLRAPKVDVEFVTALTFCCPVDPHNVEAKYENGLLKIKAPFKDIKEDSVEIEVT